MSLQIVPKKANTATVQFRIDPDTKQMLTKLRNHYGVTSGPLIKKMIQYHYKDLMKLEDFRKD